jgi:hypothetical protein
VTRCVLISGNRSRRWEQSGSSAEGSFRHNQRVFIRSSTTLPANSKQHIGREKFDNNLPSADGISHVFHSAIDQRSARHTSSADLTNSWRDERRTAPNGSSAIGMAPDDCKEDLNFAGIAHPSVVWRKHRSRKLSYVSGNRSGKNLRIADGANIVVTRADLDWQLVLFVSRRVMVNQVSASFLLWIDVSRTPAAAAAESCSLRTIWCPISRLQ